jgi:hypothetical protein
VITAAGAVEVRQPRVNDKRTPVILEPRRRIDQALYAVVMEAYVNGVSTRAVDDLVAALGIDTGISKVSRICAGLDEQVTAFRSRPLHHSEFPYVFLDAIYLHVRRAGQVTSMAVVVATGVTATGGREVLGLDIGDSEDEVFWRVPALVEGTRPDRSPVGDLRPARRTGRRPRPDVPRCRSSTLPGPLRPQPARPGAEVSQGHGRRAAPSSPNPARTRSPKPGMTCATS